MDYLPERRRRQRLRAEHRPSDDTHRNGPHLPCETRHQDKDILECWIDSRKDLTYDNSYVQRQYAIAGLDRTNGSDRQGNQCRGRSDAHKLKFRNAEFEPQGKRISLWANSKHEENTFEDRNRIVPVEDVFNNVSSSMDVTFRPQSMTVLRLKLKK
ncbi:MAG: hypothetical protein ACLS37_06535 [Alistipes sp.]